MRAKFSGSCSLEPEQFGDGVAGEGGDAEALEPALGATEAAEEVFVLGGGLGVVPELGGADDLEGFVEDH